MTDRAQRRARVRRGVAAGAVALFLASFGAVATFGRQPPAKVASAPRPSAQQDTYGQDGYGSDPYSTQDQYGQDPYSQDPYGEDTYGGDAYGGDGYGYADPQQQAPPAQDTGPAPMTTQQS